VKLDINVLDHGFVRLVEFMGGDRAVVQAARVSLGQGLDAPEKDKKLIAYMLKHHHGTPFEHAVFKFHCKMPIFVARQWIRHRMASYNEISARYTEVEDEYYLPTVWRAGGNATNKQGSLGPLPTDRQPRATAAALIACRAAFKAYGELLDLGVAKELARIVLPVNTYTQWYWTVNARTLLQFFGLRSDKHAQWEMRQYSNALWQLFAGHMPWTAEAWLETINRANYTAEAGDPLPGPHFLPGMPG
jgi:thymidylate synthase (FAD)